MPTPETDWIWIPRWHDFQHYRPDPARGPAWIKQHTGQLDDDRYTDLPPRARALLHDLRMAFARTRGKLSVDTRTLSKRTFSQVFRADLERLNHAGLIELVSRPVLEQRLELFYSSPRAPARSREAETEEERPKGRSEARPPAPDPPANGLPISNELHILKLLDWAWAHSDPGTERVVRGLAADLPENCLARIHESTRTSRPRDRAKWLVGALKNERDQQIQL